MNVNDVVGRTHSDAIHSAAAAPMNTMMMQLDASHTHTQGICFFATQHCLHNKILVHANFLCRFTFSFFGKHRVFTCKRFGTQLNPLSEIVDTPALPLTSDNWWYNGVSRLG